ncbi:trypsin-like peptidase domain-containing protein [Proteiniclasticum sp. QWL-01]|nr:trypsin-like peptidase domain-containing protein [Proteiniclasticum sp. QWL-01]UUM13260.1 trypsin-like peptidase domain-containing protein [Clostridiaceae bacterium HFYG-1003]WFF71684.1 trypsin-like peptidase domain-containing protein [Proteiniclasticum sp. QWL-01]
MKSKIMEITLGTALALSVLSGCAVTQGPVQQTSTLNIQTMPQIQTTQSVVTAPGNVAQGNTVPGTQAQTKESEINIDRSLSIPDLVEANAPAVVTVAVRKITDGGLFGSGYQEGVGTGFFIDANGIIATNNHVVEGAKNVTIILHNSQEVPGEVLWRDARNDLAIVKVSGIRVPGVVTIGNSDNIRVGEGVIAIGNPMSAEFAGTVTHGIISAKNRKVQVSGGVFEYIQIDAAINGGNSGGPLFNMKGEVIGINSAKIAQTGIEGIAFSIPINVLMEKIGTSSETKNQTNEPVSIGVAVQDIPEDLRIQYGVPQGIMVMEVMAGSPAEAAGILPGDILISFGGEKVTSTVQLNTIKSRYKPGDRVKFTIYRDSDKQTYEGTIQLVSAMRN